MVTVALINGHAYASGLFFALCHDYRLMKEDYGFLCVSEINLGMTLPVGFSVTLS